MKPPLRMTQKRETPPYVILSAASYRYIRTTLTQLRRILQALSEPKRLLTTYTDQHIE
jgi:hypothetical protein